MHTQVSVIQEGQKVVLNVMLQESPLTDLYYLYRQANLFLGTVLFIQTATETARGSQAGRKVTVIPCTIHIDRKKVLLALYYSHRQQLRELALKKTYIKYAKSHLNTLYYSHRQEEIGAVLFTQTAAEKVYVKKNLHQICRNFTVKPCTIHIDRKSFLLVLYYLHRQPLRKFVSRDQHQKKKCYLNTLIPCTIYIDRK